MFRNCKMKRQNDVNSPRMPKRVKPPQIPQQIQHLSLNWALSKMDLIQLQQDHKSVNSRGLSPPRPPPLNLKPRSLQPQVPALGSTWMSMISLTGKVKKLQRIRLPRNQPFRPLPQTNLFQHLQLTRNPLNLNLNQHPKLSN